jgi:hypothetical protein
MVRWSEDLLFRSIDILFPVVITFIWELGREKGKNKSK